MGHRTLIETFSALQDRLHRVACQLLRDDSEAKDAVQDTFCNLWCARLPDTDEEARYRLFAILKNVCINRLRQRRRAERIGEQDADAEMPELPGNFELLRKAILESLPEQQREVFRLAAFEELEYEEIADRLDMNIDAVRMNMSRARKKVKELYKQLQ